MEQYRITIRNPDLELVELLRETARHNHMTLGECFNDAISMWHDSLPKLEPDQYIGSEWECWTAP
jgi:hypothetical protein